jgi:hypothetical protein
MDSTISHDPFAPDERQEATTMTDAEFNEDRWLRAGASEDELAVLRVAFEAYTPEERAGVEAWMASASDADLAEYLHGKADDETFAEATDAVADLAAAEAKVAEAEADVENTTGRDQKNAKARLKRAQVKRDEAQAAHDAAVEPLVASQPVTDDEKAAAELAAAQEANESGPGSPESGSDADSAPDAAE